jgi:hypothetical protein
LSELSQSRDEHCKDKSEEMADAALNWIESSGAGSWQMMEEWSSSVK